MATSGQAGETEGTEATTTSNPNPSQGHLVGEIDLSEGAAQELDMGGNEIEDVNELHFLDDGTSYIRGTTVSGDGRIEYYAGGTSDLIIVLPWTERI